MRQNCIRNNWQTGWTLEMEEKVWHFLGKMYAKILHHGPGTQAGSAACLSMGSEMSKLCQGSVSVSVFVCWKATLIWKTLKQQDNSKEKRKKQNNFKSALCPRPDLYKHVIKHQSQNWINGKNMVFIGYRKINYNNMKLFIST